MGTIPLIGLFIDTMIRLCRIFSFNMLAKLYERIQGSLKKLTPHVALHIKPCSSLAGSHELPSNLLRAIHSDSRLMVSCELHLVCYVLKKRTWIKVSYHDRAEYGHYRY